ncbi:ion channel [Desulfobacterales bacterium HSG2]|nr:ion channel [Desulfobacterales bacterium HSG2]
MHHLFIFLKRLIALIRREKMFRVGLFLLFVISSGSLAFAFFEEKVSFIDALWWAVVTLTTVGYGDISPATTGGRFVGMTVMVIGIGFLGVLTASIATIFIEERFLENKGMKATDAKDHFIVCGWNFRGDEIVAELRADPKCSDAPLVVIADIPEKPTDDPGLRFIRGEVSTDTLEKANLGEARVVILLSDDSLDAYARDAKTILSTLVIKNLNPDIYTCVELMDSKNAEHCRMAKADEIIVVGELSTNLLVQAAIDHGITRLISELVSNRYGEEICKIKLPSDLEGRTFFEAMCELKKERNILCLGIEDETSRNLITNPDCDHKLGKDDWLIVVAAERPDF